jgi:hypothetical protein
MSSDSGSHTLRRIALPFVAAAPAGARVRTRLRVSPQDAAVLRATGAHLGSLAGRDLAARCAEGRLDARGRAQSRAARKYAGHLAVAVISPDGNAVGAPRTVPLHLAGLPATARDGRLRAAVSGLIATAREHGARAIVIEDLDFVEARAEGRERPGAGRRAGSAAAGSGGRSRACPPGSSATGSPRWPRTQA